MQKLGMHPCRLPSPSQVALGRAPGGCSDSAVKTTLYPPPSLARLPPHLHLALLPPVCVVLPAVDVLICVMSHRVTQVEQIGKCLPLSSVTSTTALILIT